MKKLLNILIIIAVSLCIVGGVSAKENDKVKIHVFYAEWCGNCQNLHKYLNELSEDKDYNKMFEIVYYRVDNDTKYGVNKNFDENKEIYLKVRNYFGNKIDDGIPLYFIGDTYKIGFPDSAKEDIKKLIKENYFSKDKKDIVQDIIDSNIDAKSVELNKTKVIGIIVIAVTVIVAGVILVIYLKNR